MNPDGSRRRAQLCPLAKKETLVRLSGSVSPARPCPCHPSPPGTAGRTKPPHVLENSASGLFFRMQALPGLSCPRVGCLGGPDLVVEVPAQHSHPPISIFAAYRKHISVGLAHTHQQVQSCRARKVLWGAGILDLLLPRSGVTCLQARHYEAVQLHFC